MAVTLTTIITLNIFLFSLSYLTHSFPLFYLLHLLFSFHLMHLSRFMMKGLPHDSPFQEHSAGDLLLREISRTPRAFLPRRGRAQSALPLATPAIRRRLSTQWEIGLATELSLLPPPYLRKALRKGTHTELKTLLLQESFVSISNASIRCLNQPIPAI